MANNGRQRLCLPPPRSKEERDRCRIMFESGSSYREISEIVGTPVSTLRVWNKREKWVRASSEQLAITPATIADDIPETLPEQAAEYEDNLRRAAVTFSRFVAELPGEAITAKAQNLKAVDQTARKALRIETEKPMQVINLAVLAASPAKAARAKGDVGQLRSAQHPRLLMTESGVIESGE